MNPFHLSIPLENLAISRKFYKEVLECEEGRSYKRENYRTYLSY
jgi:extradiol dioxygenase family protein